MYRDQGKYGRRRGLYKRALAITENAKGANHPDVAWTLTNLALLYWSQGRYGDAEALHKRALAIREQVLGESHPGVADALHNLALVYWEQGKYSEAEGLYKRALAIREQALGGESPRRGPKPQQPSARVSRPGQVQRGGGAPQARAGDPRSRRSVRATPTWARA